MANLRIADLSCLGLLLLVVLGFSSPADAAAYIKIGDIKGESTDANHDKWIDVLSIDWGSHSATPPRSGGGKLTISKYVDKASASLNRACATGKRFDQVTLSTSTGKSATPYLRYEMKKVRITSCTAGTGGTAGDARPTQQISLNFSSIKWTYDKQVDKSGGKATGTTYDPHSTGASSRRAKSSISRTSRAKRSTGRGPISPQLERLLEKGDSEQAAALCGPACKTSGGKSISSGSGGTAAPDCKDGNCSCNGVVDCVGMTDLCVPDTMGCNDYGCACKHNGNDPDGGG